MNRIERLIWEETQLKEVERLQRKSHGMTGAKIILIAMLVCLIALVASRVSMPPLDDDVVRALVPTSVFFTCGRRAKPGKRRRAFGIQLRRDTADEMERAAAHDEPPIASFGHQPRLHKHEPFVAPSSSVQAPRRGKTHVMNGNGNRHPTSFPRPGGPGSLVFGTTYFP